VVVLQGLEVGVLALEEGFGGDFGAGFEQRGLVRVEVAVVEALVGEELELVVLLCGAVLSDDVLVCCDFCAVLAFKDVGLACVDAWGSLLVRLFVVVRCFLQ
jgi:hypothetical protein